uniref:Transport system permease protein n=1 Tax=uncultured organism TaxID=155900 RepID=M1QBK4_9ZZZZ|nr:transport system permease protein [uncultured organism]
MPSDLLNKYHSYNKRKFLFGIFSLIILLILFFLSIGIGPVNITAKKIISILLGNDSSFHYSIIWNIRLPRTLTAIVAGMGLAVAGATMQSVLRNPLGSPFTLGISHAAAFGAAFSIIILGAGSLQSSGNKAVIINNPYITTFSAFIWALISALIILFLAKYKKATPETMVLSGVAIGSLFTAATTALQYFATDVELASLVFWTFGDVGRTTWSNLLIISLVVFTAAVYIIFNSWNYNALDSGEETAKSLGVDVEKIRTRSLLISSLVTAIIVSFVGIIGFVGLVVPHIVRKIIGGNERFLLPFSCLAGAVLLLLSDVAARNIMAPVVLPVGILTSFLGAPLFIYLVIKGREYW